MDHSEAPRAAGPTVPAAQRGRDHVTVERATGVLAQRGNVSVDVAFARLIRYARAHRVRLADLAGEVVETDLAAVDVLTFGAADAGRATQPVAPGPTRAPAS